MKVKAAEKKDDEDARCRETEGRKDRGWVRGWVCVCERVEGGG